MPGEQVKLDGYGEEARTTSCLIGSPQGGLMVLNNLKVENLLNRERPE